jgi:surfactin synthase thioesterase subunit
MNKIKRFALVFFLYLGMQQSYSQTYKFKTSGFSILEKNNKEKWGKWSDLNLVNILVTLDTNKNRFVVYSQIVQLFEIVEYIPTQENDTDIVYSFTCKDNNGLDCTISIITRKQQENRKQLYITYDDHIILYNIFNM